LGKTNLWFQFFHKLFQYSNNWIYVYPFSAKWLWAYLKHTELFYKVTKTKEQAVLVISWQHSDWFNYHCTFYMLLISHWLESHFGYVWQKNWIHLATITNKQEWIYMSIWTWWWILIDFVSISIRILIARKTSFVISTG
jgi:hypothetical protein